LSADQRARHQQHDREIPQARRLFQHRVHYLEYRKNRSLTWERSAAWAGFSSPGQHTSHWKCWMQGAFDSARRVVREINAEW
jgi:hypothetical protein